MATTTPNYGWPVPTSTDYVKDGATAIEALGDAIDATVFGLGSGAETVITSANFTSQSTINLTNVFSSTYKFYNFRIFWGANSSNAQDLNFRFRENTTDKATAYFQGGIASSITGSSSASWSRNNDTYFILSNLSSSNGGFINMKIARPDATTGIMNYNMWSPYINAGGAGGGYNLSMSNFTGLSIFTSAGTNSGSYILTGIK